MHLWRPQPYQTLHLGPGHGIPGRSPLFAPSTFLPRSSLSQRSQLLSCRVVSCRVVSCACRLWLWLRHCHGRAAPRHPRRQHAHPPNALSGASLRISRPSPTTRLRRRLRPLLRAALPCLALLFPLGVAAFAFAEACRCQLALSVKLPARCVGLLACWPREREREQVGNSQVGSGQELGFLGWVCTARVGVC
jgi:hypothetical protein